MPPAAAREKEGSDLGAPPLASTEAGLLRAAALNLGLGAVPHLSHLLRAAAGGAQEMRKSCSGPRHTVPQTAFPEAPAGRLAASLHPP